jgi:hypothetical protein
MFFTVGYAAAMPDTQPAALAWLHPLSLRAMQSAAAGALASGSADAAAEAAREVALAHYPALPLPMIAEAVAEVIKQQRHGNGVPARPAPAPPTSGLRSRWSQAPAIGFRPLALQSLALFHPSRNISHPGATGCRP